jgi:5-methyltetrahydropteroyltriglutamate--homocysteine methyltransferase
MIVTAVGNYPKVSERAGSPNLRRAIGRFELGEISAEELRAVQDAVTREVIDEQVEAGLDLVTDGMIRWDDGQTYIARALDGFQITGLIRYFDSNTYYRQPLAVAPVRWRGPITVEDYKFASSYSPKPVKAVLTGPYTLAKLSKDGYYHNLRAFVMDLAVALNQEALALQDAGAPVIQFDEPSIVRSPADFPLLVEASTVLVKGISRSRTAIYTYFGSVAGVGPSFFQLPFDIIGLDFVEGPDNWGLLSHFPKDKALAAGIVDARNTKMETVEDLVGILSRLSRQVDLGRLHVNPSCGLEFLPRTRAFEKLQRLAEGARRAQEVLV